MFKIFVVCQLLMQLSWSAPLPTALCFKAPEPRKPGTEYQALADAFREARHRIETKGAEFHVKNPANGFEVDFTSDGLVAATPDGSVGFQLARYGYGDRLRAPEAASITVSGRRIEYHRGALTEWYVNDDRGLEQGFTLHERCGEARREPLVFELRVNGDVTPTLREQSVSFDRAGRTLLTYSGLKAWDSTGRELLSHMEVRDGYVRLVVSDAEAVYPLVVDPWVQQQVFNALDRNPVPGDGFGQPVAVSGNTALIGADGSTVGSNVGQGSVYVFVRSGATWIEQQKLTASDGTALQGFGYAVAVDGDTAVIGVNALNSHVPHAAYVFVRNGGIWIEQAKLIGSDIVNPDRRTFASSVAVNGDTAVIGAEGELNVGAGAAYVFVRVGSTWTQQQILRAPDGRVNDTFGRSIAVSGDTAIVGAAAAIRAAYIFTRTAGTWSLQQKLTGSPGSNFGHAVALDGDTALVGDFFGIPPGFEGNAYVFVRSGASWTLQQKLAASDGTLGAGFGGSVSLSGDIAVIGADFQPKGAAYVFSRNQTAWSEQSKLTAPLPVTGDRFGFSVSVSRDAAVIGALEQVFVPSAAYAFTPNAEVTIQTVPPGLLVSIDGGPLLAAPQTVVWAAGSSGHTIATISPQPGSAGVQHSWLNWTDGGAMNHTITAPTAPTSSYTATFAPEFLLTAQTSPPNGGTVTVPPPSATGFYPAGTNASVLATPNPAFVFLNWSGGVASPTIPGTTVVMNAPQSVTANFVPALTTMFASAPTKSGPSNARMWSIQLTNNGPGFAANAQIDSLSLTQTFGTACTPVLPATFPIGVGSIAPSASATGQVLINFSGCPLTARFTATINFSANNSGVVGTKVLSNQFQ